MYEIGNIIKIKVKGNEYLARIVMDTDRESSLACQFFDAKTSNLGFEVIFPYKFLNNYNDDIFNFPNIYLHNDNISYESVQPFLRYSIDQFVKNVKSKEKNLIIKKEEDIKILDNYIIKQCEFFEDFKCKIANLKNNEEIRTTEKACINCSQLEYYEKCSQLIDGTTIASIDSGILNRQYVNPLCKKGYPISDLKDCSFNSQKTCYLPIDISMVKKPKHLLRASDDPSNIQYADTLLPTFNRRYVDTFFPKIIDEVISDKKPVSLIMLDIDNFKLFNKDYGHLVGDDVLKTVGSLIKKNSEGKGEVARLGGEEICIIVPAYDIDAATDLAEIIRKQIESYSFSITAGKIVKITISAGVSTTIKHSDYKDLIKEADVAMRVAKSRGRNRVEKFREEYLNSNFDLVIIESIKDNQIKQDAVMAIDALKNNRLEEAARFIKLAFDRSLHKWKNDYHKKKGIRLSNISILEAIQGNILDFNLAEYSRFEALLPHITWFESGNHQIIIKRSYTLDTDAENIKFCLKFFLDSLSQFQKDVEI